MLIFRCFSVNLPFALRVFGGFKPKVSCAAATTGYVREQMN